MDKATFDAKVTDDISAAASAILLALLKAGPFSPVVKMHALSYVMCSVAASAGFDSEKTALDFVRQMTTPDRETMRMHMQHSRLVIPQRPLLTGAE